MQHLQRLRLLWEALCGESEIARIQCNAEQHMPDWKHALFGVIVQQKLLQAILSSSGCLLWDLSLCSHADGPLTARRHGRMAYRTSSQMLPACCMELALTQSRNRMTASWW